MMRCCCRRSCFLYSSSFLFVALFEEKSEDGGSVYFLLAGLCKEKSSSEDASRGKGMAKQTETTKYPIFRTKPTVTDAFRGIGSISISKSRLELELERTVTNALTSAKLANHRLRDD
eukprot:scaffold181527_cov42-Attheya_sp.AAC.1